MTPWMHFFIYLDTFRDSNAFKYSNVSCSIRAGTNYLGCSPRKPYIPDRWSSQRHVMVEETKDTPSDHSGSVNGAAEGIRTREAQRPLVFQPSSICDGWRARRAVAVMKGLYAFFRELASVSRWQWEYGLAPN